MIRVLTTRPTAWHNKTGRSITVRHVQVGQPDPRLRTGEVAGDEMGEVCTKKGAATLVAEFRKWQPQVFLFGVHFGAFSPQLLQTLRKHVPDCLFVHWSGNQVFDPPRRVCWYIHQYHNVTDVVLTSTHDPQRLRLIERWVPRAGCLWTYGFDPGIFTAPFPTWRDWKPRDRALKYDCFFGGGNSVSATRTTGRFPYSKFRYDLMHALKMVGNSVRMRGAGWPWKVENGIRGLEYFKDMQRARIVLGTYHDDLHRRYSKRTVYGLASGKLFMTRYVPGMEEDFTNHRDLVWFSTVNEALELVDRYLEDVETRKEIGECGRVRAKQLFSWDALFEEFEGIVGKLLKGEPLWVG